MAVKWHPEKAIARVRKDVVSNLWRIGFLIEADAKRLCPVDTGRLRASLITDVDERSLAVRVGSSPHLLEHPTIAGVVGTDVYYAKYVELGTYKMKARPFLTPAMWMNKSNALALLGGNPNMVDASWRAVGE
jgi:HK97 gp10 family phage protein